MDTGIAVALGKKKNTTLTLTSSNKGVGWYDLMVEQIAVPVGCRRCGHARALLTKELLQFVLENGATGVTLNQAISPHGGQLLRHLVVKHGWTTNGTLPHREEQMSPFKDDSHHATRTRIAKDNYLDATRIANVQQLMPWMKRVRSGFEDARRKFVINNTIYVLLHWSRIPRLPNKLLESARECAYVPDSAYSPL